MKPNSTPGAGPHTYQPILNALPFPALILAPNPPIFTILAANEAYTKLTNNASGQITGSPFFDLFPNNGESDGEDLERRLAASLTMVAEQQQAHTMPQLKYKASLPGQKGAMIRYWSLNNTPVFDTDGQLSYILHTATDITEKVAHDELVIYPAKQVPEHEDSTAAGRILRDASAEYLQAVIDTAQTGIFLFSPVRDEAGDLSDFRFRIANRMLAAYVGQEPDAIVGALGSTWFPAFKTNGLFDFYADTYLTGKNNRFEFHYLGDGIDVWLDIMATRINDDVLVTFSDFTPLKHLQQSMAASLSSLKQSNDNLEQFAYIASHDLQEPLRKIKSFGDMLGNRYKELLGPEGADMIGRMQGAADRMKILIEDLLLFSRISVQKNELVPVDLNKVVQEVLADLEPAIREKQAVIKIEELQPVTGNALQMRQAFQNLLSNAIKFNKKGEISRISITSAIIPGAKVQGFNLASDQRKKNYQQLLIQDNGIGFEQQYAERIFQIFQRLHGRMEYPGTGVGLSIVQKVVEAHSGFIRADSEPGQGALFTLLLPA